MEAAAAKADVLLLSAMSWLGIHVAEAFRIPSMGVYLPPLDPSAEFQPWPLTNVSLSAWGNRTTSAAVPARDAGLHRAVSELRARHGLRPITPARLIARFDREQGRSGTG